MKIMGIEKVSLVDYPGKICATIFLGGCNLRCPFCHNSGVVEQQYQEQNIDDILQYLSERKNLLDAVTISGGEPTLQKEVLELARKIKSMGYLVKLDTNGTNPVIVQQLIEENSIDYVAMDIKNDFDHYSDIVGIANFDVTNIRKTLRILHQSNIEYELRTTLVAEYHNIENIKLLSQDLQGEKVLYLQKFKDSETCFKQNLHAIPDDELLQFIQILSRTINEVKVRGY